MGLCLGFVYLFSDICFKISSMISVTKAFTDECGILIWLVFQINVN